MSLFNKLTAKHVALYLLLILGAYPSMQAQESKEEKVARIYKLSHWEKAAEPLSKLFKTFAPNISDSTLKEIFDFPEGLMDKIQEIISAKMMENFNEQELDTLLDFYSSTTGQKLMGFSNNFNEGNEEILQTWMEERIESYYGMVEEQNIKNDLSGVCEDLQEGEFYYFSQITGDTIPMLRTNKEQIEWYGPQKQKFEYAVDWKTPCKYTLELKKINGEKYKGETDPTHVQIVEVKKGKYKFMAFSPKSKYVHIAHIYWK